MSLLVVGCWSQGVSLIPLPERIEVVESSTEVVSNALHRFVRVAKRANGKVCYSVLRGSAGVVRKEKEKKRWVKCKQEENN